MDSPNRALLSRVATRLEPLLNDMVFVGGQIAELLITDPAATRVRPTDDVDVVCQASTKTEYYQLGERLKELGFTQDMRQGAPTCRWRVGDDVVDVMPSEERVLGLKGRWLPEVLRSSQIFQLDDNIRIKIAAAPAFLATKADAFEDRGGGDWYTSHDIEDFIVVIAGRPSIVSEIDVSEKALKEYVVNTAAAFLKSDSFDDIVLGALPDARVVPGTTETVLTRFEEIARL